MNLILSIESSCDDSGHSLSQQTGEAALSTLTLGSTRRGAYAPLVLDGAVV